MDRLEFLAILKMDVFEVVAGTLVRHTFGGCRRASITVVAP